MPPRPIQVKPEPRPEIKPKPEPTSPQSSPGQTPTPSPSPSPEPTERGAKKKRKKIGATRSKVKTAKSDGSVMHRRSREGCYTCRVRRKKCDELTPVCKACRNLHLKCEYDKPDWWQNADMRKRHKEKIKESIRAIKPHNAHSVTKKPAQKTPVADDTPPSLCSSQPTAGTFSEPFHPHSHKTSSDVFSPSFDLNTPRAFFDATPMMGAPQWTPLQPQYPPFSPPSWEVDIKTERQVYIDEHPAWKESSISTFGTFQPATPTVMLPSFPPNAWTKHDRFEVTTESFGEEPLEPSFFEFGREPQPEDQEISIQVEDCDRPLLGHFLDSVAPFIFSVFDARQKGSSLSDVVLPQLKDNPIYLHCCLSTSALHLKITENIVSEQIDNDIIRHRAATISSLCEAFSDEKVQSTRLLEATLALVLFQSSVGSCDDGLPDIPWHAHFQAVHTLIENGQQLTPVVTGTKGHHAAFNTTMAYWIDILGATALRRVPLFADTYRHKIETAEPSGLAELMGCDDRVMYLISEISCLDNLQESVNMDDVTLCSHIAGLGERLSQTEIGPTELGSVYTPGSGAIRPRQLTRNITAVFRFAARIYLCSLVPDFDRHQLSIMGLVDAFTEAIAYVPSGPDGFDRALVWPLLMVGSVSVPAAPFRDMFYMRSKELGSASQFGSFGRVKELLEEVWLINDEHTAKGEQLGIHWWDAMRHKGLDYLII